MNSRFDPRTGAVVFEAYPDRNEVLSGLFADLFKLTGEKAIVEQVTDPDEGPLGQYGVWVGGDLLGAGGSQSEALEDAIKTARGWS